MVQSNGSRKWPCDCASVFDTPQSFGEHVQKTGHMKPRWCTLCHRLFASKESLGQHKRTAAKHKKNPTVPPKVNVNTPVSDKKPQVEKPKVSPNKPAQVPKATKTPKAARGVTNATKNPAKNCTTISSNASQSLKVGQMSMSTYQVAPLTELLNPLAKNYPWASGWQEADIIQTATFQCHSECRLLDQGYYTGDPSYRGGQKFNIRKFVSTPPRVNGSVKRKAIALDCEMVGIRGGNQELAHLCAVDLFTGEVLIDTLVHPTEPVEDWRTRWSGVTPAKMAVAKASGKALDGWPAAREKLFEFADAETIFVGHALNHDLRALYIAHKRVIDSAILIAEAVFGRAQRLLSQWGLKNATQELFNIKIQTLESGHDCLEDALAARELVLWCLKEPEKLSEWGKNALVKYDEERRKIYMRRRAKERAKKEKEEREKEKQPFFARSSIAARSDEGRENNYGDYYDDDYDYDYSQLHGRGDIGIVPFHDYNHGEPHGNDSL
ncbi:ribonuclease H-like protein [Annulohypoxylon truncatum]|uniref:ribonuclease H-like protein n=1 Tax=Annulohypoxylon truncatum TaxID=327061 RepID=UPI0020073EDD|nr:ribonuclease H-like protein [Annulohypoxylon truncatum]KAI1207926.1 ribonuclease H-like protein [Annulohypoxylon truncatum]